jgi:hypothetical protein
MFLGTAELRGMTGTPVRRLQQEWLKDNRIPYTVSRKGNINVLRKVVERAHGYEEEGEGGRTWQPNRNVFKQHTGSD